jgi:putative PIN family toxin of toxin-antitoxin system
LAAASEGRPGLVIDTNIVLDLFVFNDPATHALRDALAAQHYQWLATQAMRDELERVLDYPKIVARLTRHALSALEVLTHFDAHAELKEVAAKAVLTCADPDDQKFIDLAVAHQTLLLSKDQAVLCMAKRLLAHTVRARAAL